MRYHLEEFGEVQVELFLYHDDIDGEPIFTCHCGTRHIVKSQGLASTESEAIDSELWRLEQEKEVLDSQIEVLKKLKEARR